MLLNSSRLVILFLLSIQYIIHGFNFNCQLLKSPPKMMSKALPQKSSQNRKQLQMTKENENNRPKLVVFDLDATLWHPEMFQLRGNIHQDPSNKRIFDSRGVEVQLCSDVKDILQEICTEEEWEGTKIAVASRTNKPDWARKCLEYFKVGDKKMKDVISYKEIYPGNKVQHFGQIRKKSGIPYDEMLFFDDWHRNCADVGRLGVVTSTVNKRVGLTLRDWKKGVQSYAQRQDALQNTEEGSKKLGICKWFNAEKGYGFITPLEGGEDIFVHVSEVGNADRSLIPGDEVEYQEGTNRKNGKLHALSVELLSSIGKTKQSTADEQKGHRIPVRCFSMAQPFASILLHGHKTIESRNNPMFESVRGTVALQVGRKDWRDKQYLQEFDKVNMPRGEVNRLTKLPTGFKRGCIVGLVDIGETVYCPTEDLTEDIERAVVASGKNVGRYLTFVSNPRWLKYPVPCKGSPGIFNASIPENAIADSQDPVLSQKTDASSTLSILDGIQTEKKVENEFVVQV